MSETERQELTLKEHLKAIRSKVKPENCARSSKQAKRAAKARWDRYRMAQATTSAVE